MSHFRSTTLNSLALLILTLIPTLALATPNITWSITNYTTYCSPGTCTYHFNITGPEASTSGLGSAFATYCHGFEAQGGYAACASSGVEANLVSEEVGLVLDVQRTVGEDGSGADSGDSGVVTLYGNVAVVTSWDTTESVFEVVATPVVPPTATATATATSGV